MNSLIQAFYANVRSKVSKDSDLPNFFTYYLTIDLRQSSATVSAIRKCYEDCDLHPPSWLASHFSSGLNSKPRRFVKRDGGYRLEGALRDRIAALIGEQTAPDTLSIGREPAGIEYCGVPGASKECKDAVLRLVQFGNHIVRARLLTCSNRHCLLLNADVGLVAIKSGFSSGYGGEGPRTLSFVLQVLRSHGVEVDEYEIDDHLFERVDSSVLSTRDIERINDLVPVRPMRWHDYISEDDFGRARDGTLWDAFPAVIPFAVIDARIIDLALVFWNDPDDKLLKGYRRLEDLVRGRTGIDEHGAKLFSQAFAGSSPKLAWPAINDSERVGRVNLFTGAYMAHRNPRAHRELNSHEDAQLTEFLLLNHLFRLEKTAESP